MNSFTLTLAAAFGALCFLPGSMLAPPQHQQQAGDGKQRSLREYLELSPEQVRALDRLQTQQRGRARLSIQNLEEKQNALRTRLAASNSDVLAIGKLVVQLELAKNRAEVTSNELRSEALAQLTVAQRAKLDDLEQAKELQPVVREAMGKFLLSPPESLLSGTGPLGMFPAPKRGGPGGGGRRPASLDATASILPTSLPLGSQHAEHHEVVKLSVE